MRCFLNWFEICSGDVTIYKRLERGSYSLDTAFVFFCFFSAVVRSFICSICCYYSHSCVQPLCSLQNLSRVSLLGIMCNATHLCGCWRLFRIIACQKKLFLVRAYTAPVILCFIKMTLYQFRRALHFHCSVNFSSNQSNNEKI